MAGPAPEIPVDGRGKRVALIASSFHEGITDELVAGARAQLLAAGVAREDIVEYRVPGVFELTPACRQVLSLGPEVDALVTLGAVIRGETPHFDFIAQASAQALQSLASEINVPLAFGVLTTDTREQAVERASRGGLDKGGEAARAALVQAALYDRLREREPAVRGFQLS